MLAGKGNTRRWILSIIIAFGVFMAMGLVGTQIVRADSVPTGQEMLITLANNPEYRWNANDSAMKNSVVHLDRADGNNCHWRFDPAVTSSGGGYYGIKHIKNGGTDRFADVADKSRDHGTPIHLWESRDDKVSYHDNRCFQFIRTGQDSAGNDKYKIKAWGGWLTFEGYNRDNPTRVSGNPKIVTTNINYEVVEWYITPNVVPRTKGEKDADNILAPYGKNYLNCQIFKANDMAALNRDGDKANADTPSHFYTVGTSSKWRLTWVSQYQAYQIEALNNDGSSTKKVLYTFNTGTGTPLYLESPKNFNNNQGTAQLWRLEKQSDNSYKIRNALSGLYLEEKSGKTGDNVCAGTKGTKVDISIIGSNSRSQIDFGIAQHNDSLWMKDLPDDALLSSVNMPATHDTGTAVIPLSYFSSCQGLFYGEQLNVGVRSFDIRCNALGDNATAKDVKIIHGGGFFQCADSDGSDLTLKRILDDSVLFLKTNPGESIVLLVKPDSGSTKGLENALKDFIEKNGNYVYKGGDIPSVGEARGKIVFLRRFELSSDKSYTSDVKAGMGFDLHDWDSHPYDGKDYALKIYDKNGNHVYAQDNYKTFSGTDENLFGDKWKSILGTMQQTTELKKDQPIDYNSWVYNYTSCAGNPIGSPLKLTRPINKNLFHNEGGCIDHRFLGMMMLNYADQPMAKLIYDTNKGLVFEPKVKAPTVTVTKGSTLSKAEVEYASEKPVGVWTFDKPDTVVDSSQKYAATFTPEDTKTYKKVKMDIDVTVVNKQEENATSQTDEMQETLKESQSEANVGTNQTVASEPLTSTANTISEKTVEVEQNTPSVTFPTSATLTYGQHLSEAIFTGQSGDGTFSFDDGDKILSAGTSKQEMTFVPYGTNANNIVKQNVTVTVNRAEVTVTPVRQEKVYGRRLLNNKLKYAVNGLVNGDDESKLNLNIRLKADGGLKARDKVDAYTIGYVTKTWNNNNYDVKFEDGILIVQPYTLKANWPNAGEYLFTGRRVRLMPQLDKVLFNDDCTFEVEGNVQRNLGTYQAAITALKGKDRFNYVLADNSDKTFKIVKTLSPGADGQASSGQTGANTKAKTGDDTSVLIYLAAFAAACGVVAYLFRRKRENKV